MFLVSLRKLSESSQKGISLLKNDFLNAEIRLLGNGTNINNGLDSCDFIDFLRSIFYSSLCSYIFDKLFGRVFFLHFYIHQINAITHGSANCSFWGQILFSLVGPQARNDFFAFLNDGGEIKRLSFHDM